MSRPFWQAPAEAAYAVLLYCYPRRIRERHGEEMRQAFRDRCREAAARNQSAWHLFALELAPDFTLSVAGAHLEGPTMKHPRIALAAFALLGCAWLFHDALSQRFLDAYFYTALHYRHWQEERAFARDEAKLRALADRLAISRGVHERSLAAYLYALNFAARRYSATYMPGANKHIDFEPVLEDGARASKLLATLPQSIDVESARLALAACRLDAGCPRLARVEALARVEPENAFAWSELLALHSKAGDEAAVREDLRKVAQSTSYRDGLEGVVRETLASALRANPNDAATVAALGRQLEYADALVLDDYTHSIFQRCSATTGGADFRGKWLQQHPDATSDCRQAARLMAQSTISWQAGWGLRWLSLDQPGSIAPDKIAATTARLRERNAAGRVDLGEHRWRPWTDAEWHRWAKAYTAAN